MSESELKAKADAMQALSTKIMLAIPSDADVDLLACALGSVVGCFAVVSNNPVKFIATLANIAQGIIDGSLLD